MKPADFYSVCNKDVWSHRLLGNEAKDNTTESKLSEPNTSLEIYRELNPSKALFPVGKASPLTDSGAAYHRGGASWLQGRGFPGSLNRVLSLWKILWTPVLSVPAPSTPANHYFKFLTSFDSLWRRKSKWRLPCPGGSRPRKAALQHHRCRRASGAQRQQGKQEPSDLSPPSTAQTHTPEQHWLRWGSPEAPQFPACLYEHRKRHLRKAVTWELWRGQQPGKLSFFST